MSEPRPHGSTAVTAPAGTATEPALLEIEDLTSSYGPVRALDGVSLSAAPGRITEIGRAHV